MPKIKSFWNPTHTHACTFSHKGFLESRIFPNHAHLFMELLKCFLRFKPIIRILIKEISSKARLSLNQKVNNIWVMSVCKGAR